MADDLSDPAAEQALATELYAIARATASAHGRSFKPIADGGVQQLTQAASAEVFSPTQFGTRSAKEASLEIELRKDHARSAIKLLVSKMAAYAATIPGYEADLLGERTLNHALTASGFCPCWPFC